MVKLLVARWNVNWSAADDDADTPMMCAELGLKENRNDLESDAEIMECYKSLQTSNMRVHSA